MKTNTFNLQSFLKVILLPVLATLGGSNHSLANNVDSCHWTLGEFIENYDSIGLPTKMDIKRLNKYILSLSGQSGVSVTQIGEPYGFPVYKIKIASKTQSTDSPPMRVLLTSGVHGNEFLGVTAMMQVVESFLSNPRLRKNFELTAVVINPPALAKGERRVSSEKEFFDKKLNQSELETLGTDLNRTFFASWPKPYDSIRQSLVLDTYDFGIDLHGGPQKDSFFLIKGREDGAFTKKILKGIQEMPFLPSRSGLYPGYAGSTSTKPNAYRMLSPGESISQNEGTMKSWMMSLNVWWSGTFEYPGRMDPVYAHAGLYRMAISAMWNARKFAPPEYRGHGKK